MTTPVYSSNGETFQEDLVSLIEETVWGVDAKPGDVLKLERGLQVEVTAADLARHTGELVLECMEEGLNDLVGEELAADWDLEKAPREKFVADLRVWVDKWMTEQGLQPRCFAVENVQPFAVRITAVTDEGVKYDEI